MKAIPDKLGPAPNDPQSASAQEPVSGSHQMSDSVDNDKTQIRSRDLHKELASDPVSEAPGTVGGAGAGGTTGSAGRTGSTWVDPSGWANAGSAPLGTGSVINSRFILIQSIGRGGMGTVYRARDIRKEEAQDRNPYVAIKVLNEDFKQHPESLRALQREARKAQKLAHPNIVTVFDFDRDGANVYMVMELLEGEPLDRLIKRTEGLGLGIKDAMRLIRGICRAMDYAHEQGIVHADFKPANAFLTRSNVVKVFDFGIARAVKRTDPTGEGGPEPDGLTLFDPGTLGALTPAYAGCEVIEGLDPDPRDDVYAIACVAYELITGRHPFNGLSAAQAEKAGLAPKPPAEMSARHWRALRRSLAFRRHGRPKSAMEFFEAVRPLRRSPATYAVASVAAIIGLVLASALISAGIEKFREHSAVATLASADPRRIEPMLSELQALDPASRGSLFLHDEARAGLIKYFEARMNALVDASKGRYQYPQAKLLLQQLEGFFPDSQAVRDVRDRLADRENKEIRRQSDAFDLDLQRGWLIAAQNRENIGSVLAIVRQIDPKSLLLSDARLPGAFAESSRQALQRKDPVLADALVNAGLTFAPQDAALIDLQDQTQRALNAQRLQARQSYLEQSVRALSTSPDVFAATEAQNKDIEALRAIDSDDAALAELRQHLQVALDARMAGQVRDRQFDQALAELARYADLVSSDYVDRKRQELLAAQSKVDVQPVPSATVASAPAADSPANAPRAGLEGTRAQWRAQLTAGLAEPTLTLAQARALAAIVDELAWERDPDATALKRQLASRLARIAVAIKRKEGLDAAATFTRGAYSLFPESTALKKTLIDLLVAAAQHDSTRRAASITEIKSNIDALLTNTVLDAAWDNAFKRELRQLSVYVPQTDPYVSEVKTRASRLYVTQAGQLRAGGHLTEASRMLELSHEYQPESAERTVEEALLADARTRQALGEKELDRAAYLSALKQKLIIQAKANDITAAETSLRVLRESVPADDRFMMQDAPGAIAQAYARMAWGAVEEGQFKSAVDLINRSRLSAPASDAILTAQARYIRYQALDEYLTTSAVIDVRKVRSEISAWSLQDVNAAKLVVPLLARDFVARMHAASDPDVASNLMHVGREIFPNDRSFRGG
jgi:serine/threonine protein kinase